MRALAAWRPLVRMRSRTQPRVPPRSLSSILLLLLCDVIPPKSILLFAFSSRCAPPQAPIRLLNHLVEHAMRWRQAADNMLRCDATHGARRHAIRVRTRALASNPKAKEKKMLLAEARRDDDNTERVDEETRVNLKVRSFFVFLFFALIRFLLQIQCPRRFCPQRLRCDAFVSSALQLVPTAGAPPRARSRTASRSSISSVEASPSSSSTDPCLLPFHQPINYFYLFTPQALIDNAPPLMLETPAQPQGAAIALSRMEHLRVALDEGQGKRCVRHARCNARVPTPASRRTHTLSRSIALPSLAYSRSFALSLFRSRLRTLARTTATAAAVASPAVKWCSAKWSMAAVVSGTTRDASSTRSRRQYPPGRTRLLPQTPAPS